MKPNASSKTGRSRLGPHLRLASVTPSWMDVRKRCGVMTGLLVILTAKSSLDLGGLFSLPTSSPACLLVVTIIESVNHTSSLTKQTIQKKCVLTGIKNAMEDSRIKRVPPSKRIEK